MNVFVFASEAISPKTSSRSNIRFFRRFTSVLKGLLVASVVLVGSLAEAVPPKPSVIYVNQNATGAVNDGSSWARAFLTLQEALTQASITTGADQIWVAQGTYVTGSTFLVPDQVSVYGGFSGAEKSLKQRKLTLASVTALTGVAGTSIVTVTGANATLDGLDISGGSAAVGGGSLSLVAATC